MLNYQNIAHYFGASLSDQGFLHFLKTTFPNLSEYDITESAYIIYEAAGIELGFTNHEPEYDEDTDTVFNQSTALFSHFNIYPTAASRVSQLPFGVNFDDNRGAVIRKAGKPTQTNQGYMDVLDKHYLVDNYKLNNTIITFDYEAINHTINFIQIRDNNLVNHLRL